MIRIQNLVGSSPRLLTILLLGFFTISSHAQENTEEKYVFDEICEVMEGMNVTHDYKFGTAKSGGINNSYTGKISLKVSEPQGTELQIAKALKSDGKIEEFFFVTEIVKSDTRIQILGYGGNSVVLSREYKNEWYGLMTSIELQENQGVVFVQPLKCIID